MAALSYIDSSDSESPQELLQDSAYFEDLNISQKLFSLGVEELLRA